MAAGGIRLPKDVTLSIDASQTIPTVAERVPSALDQAETRVTYQKRAVDDHQQHHDETASSLRYAAERLAFAKATLAEAERAVGILREAEQA